jgi:hypothetical protein
MLWALRKPRCATSLALYLTTTLFSVHPRMKTVGESEKLNGIPEHKG